MKSEEDISHLIGTLTDIVLHSTNQREYRLAYLAQLHVLLWVLDVPSGKTEEFSSAIEDWRRKKRQWEVEYVFPRIQQPFSREGR